MFTGGSKGEIYRRPMTSIVIINVIFVICVKLSKKHQFFCLLHFFQCSSFVQPSPESVPLRNTSGRSSAFYCPESRKPTPQCGPVQPSVSQSDSHTALGVSIQARNHIQQLPVALDTLSCNQKSHRYRSDCRPHPDDQAYTSIP